MKTETQPLVVSVKLSAAQSTVLLRLIRTGMFGGPDPTLASVLEEIVRGELRRLELEGWVEEDS
jgi:hypothetical protein